MLRQSKLTADNVRARLEYDPERGVFYHRTPPQKKLIGQVAGAVNNKGYRIIKVHSIPYKAHRLAWLYMHGEWPPDQVDHIDLDKDNNRIANLRLASNGQNACNRGHCNSRSGLKGVHWNGKNKKWQVRVTANGIYYYLGSFVDPKEAYVVSCSAIARLHGEFARTT